MTMRQWNHLPGAEAEQAAGAGKYSLEERNCCYLAAPAQVNLTAEFDNAWRNRTQEHRRRLAEVGVTLEAILRVGDLGVERIAIAGNIYAPDSAGFPAIILPSWWPAAPSPYCAIDAPAILDLIALRIDERDRWWQRLGVPGLILGEHHYLKAVETDEPVRLFFSPLDWLQGGCAGVCFVDDARCRWAAERAGHAVAESADWWGAAA